MNIEQVFQSIVNQGMSAPSPDQVTDLIQRYPYCQALHFTKLKLLKDSGDREYNDYVRLASAYAPNREYLYNLIHEPVSAVTIETQVEERIEAYPAEPVSAVTIDEQVEERIEEYPAEPVSAVTIDEQVEERVESYPSEPDNEESAVDTESPEELKLQQIIDQRLRELNLVSEAPSPEYKIDESLVNLMNLHTQEESAELTEEKKETTETEITEDKQEASPMNLHTHEESTEFIEEKTESVEPEIKEDQQEATLEELPVAEFTEVLESEVTTYSEQADVLTEESSEPATEEVSAREESDPSEELPPIKTEVEPALEIDKLVTSPDPLDKLIGVHAITEKIIDPKPAPVDDKTVPHSFSEWLKIVKIKKGRIEEKGQHHSAGDPSIIDKFIQEEPRITPARSSFYSATNMARQSLAEHDDLVSETLARIHASQGNYDKAINAYEKLSLLHPEKSTYFAALIQELKEKQNL